MNYESYLKLMNGLIYILTDDHPEVRSYIVNQGLNSMLGRQMELTSAPLKGVVLRDTNEYLAVESVFDALTEQALTFEEAS